eukprot:CAMPEP_0175153202 /NCGR_PEP_ID=MMETSP0087-20121206/19590_1 /TAXON_ID=136419 /ORGANISM="Unknown Unknown, Strain D1" /LENGTH=172 /DNA_ID=CAMNT_0016439823 /DNA_START=177 /DNA_END=692 /DNA_ORIENTATION=+
MSDLAYTQAKAPARVTWHRSGVNSLLDKRELRGPWQYTQNPHLLGEIIASVGLFWSACVGMRGAAFWPLHGVVASIGPAAVILSVLCGRLQALYRVRKQLEKGVVPGCSGGPHTQCLDAHTTGYHSLNDNEQEEFSRHSSRSFSSNAHNPSASSRAAVAAGEGEGEGEGDGD